MITVHCGLPKTGTTSIQIGLRLASAKSDRLIIVPDERDDNSEEWWTQCLRKLGRSRDGILSHEGLLFGTGKELISEERVRLLRDCLAGSQFQVVIYLRPQIDWLASLYLQSATTGSTEGPELFWQRMKPQRMLIWSNLLTALREESGAVNVVARVHSSSRDAVTDFFHLCSLGDPPRVGKSPIRENLSIKAVQAPILIAINRETTSEAAEHGKLRQVFQQVLSQEAPGGFSPFPERVQRDISSTYMHDWDVVADSVGIQDKTEANVFKSESVRWRAIPIAYAGDSLEYSPVQREAMRTIGQLARNLELGVPGRLERLKVKFKSDPRGLPVVARRALLRQISKTRWERKAKGIP